MKIHEYKLVGVNGQKSKNGTYLHIDKKVMNEILLDSINGIPILSKMTTEARLLEFKNDPIKLTLDIPKNIQIGTVKNIKFKTNIKHTIQNFLQFKWLISYDMIGTVQFNSEGYYDYFMFKNEMLHYNILADVCTLSKRNLVKLLNFYPDEVIKNG